MSFNVVASATALVVFLLGVGWLFFGPLLLRRWGIESNSNALLVGRRLGAAYVGVSILLAMGRLAPPSALRDAVCAGLLLAMVLLAVLGVFEFKSGRANAVILVSVGVEVVLAAGFAWVLVVEA
jgi:hypothetical protein